MALHHFINALIGCAYYFVSFNIVRLFKETNLISTYFSARSDISKTKKQVTLITLCIAAMFALFIVLCGTMHLIVAAESGFSPDKFVLVRDTVGALCAVVSVITALMMAFLYPPIRSAIGKFELTDEGTITHLENYVVEVVDMFQESIVVLSPALFIKRGNKSTKSFFGGEFVGKNLLSSIHPDDSVLFTQAIERVSAAYDPVNEKIEYRVKHQTRSNKFRWVESTVCKRSNPSNSVTIELVMISKDIEERKHTELLQQKVAQTEAEQAINAAKLRYIACTAHDLKTPLQSFCFATDLLRGSELTDEQQEHLDMADTSISLMKLTISEAMDISKSLSGGKLQPRRSSVSVHSMLRRVQVIIDGYTKQVPITFSCASNINDSIITDEDWLWQMQLDLLTNACKYTESGWIQLSVQQCCNEDDEEAMLLFEVTDTGIGVDPATVNVIFGAFAQMQEGQCTGTGLGLYGLKMRVESLGGSCGARPNGAVECDRATDGKGSTFWFKIPYQPNMTAEAAAVKNLDFVMNALPPRIRDQRDSSVYDSACGVTSAVMEPLASSPRARDRRVSSGCDSADGKNVTSAPKEVTFAADLPKLTAIVVDDSSSICKLMNKVLRSIGFTEVEICNTGSQGLEAMKRSQVDFVFSDVQMPIMTGPEMIKRFRAFEAEALRSGARTKRQLAVVITANGQECHTDTLIGSSAFDEFCSKPVSVGHFQTIVDKYRAGDLEKKEQRK